jgi:uncharacterized protein YndB with AHSA1/START domain
MKLRSLVLLLSATASFAISGPGRGAVQETRPGAFSLQSVILVELPPAAAYRALVRLPAWWDPAHTWSGAARNLSLEPRAGGCFCEKLADGGSVQHARVIFAQPGKMLRLEGAFGPMQEMAANGVLTYTLAPDGPGTRITMTYRVAGDLTMDSTKLAPLVDQVMGSQFERLRDYANTQGRR